MKSFFRYPGGKSKLSQPIMSEITSRMHRFQITEFRKPFMGGGAISLNALSSLPGISKVWVNEFNRPLANLWSSVMSASC